MMKTSNQSPHKIGVFGATSKSLPPEARNVSAVR